MQSPHDFSPDSLGACKLCGMPWVAGPHWAEAKTAKAGAVSESVTVRDRFAMAALTGLAGVSFTHKTEVRFIADEAARYAYALADAMLKERSK